MKKYTLLFILFYHYFSFANAQTLEFSYTWDNRYNPTAYVTKKNENQFSLKIIADSDFSGKCRRITTVNISKDHNSLIMLVTPSIPGCEKIKFRFPIDDSFPSAEFYETNTNKVRLDVVSNLKIKNKNTLIEFFNEAPIEHPPTSPNGTNSEEKNAKPNAIKSMPEKSIQQDANVLESAIQQLEVDRKKLAFERKRFEDEKNLEEKRQQLQLDSQRLAEERRKFEQEKQEQTKANILNNKISDNTDLQVHANNSNNNNSKDLSTISKDNKSQHQTATNSTNLKVDFIWKLAHKCVKKSPEIMVSGIPPGTTELTVKMVDLDYRAFDHGGGFLKNEESFPEQFTILEGALKSFIGPCPPSFNSFGNDYQFTVIAKDKKNQVLGKGSVVKTFSAKAVKE